MRVAALYDVHGNLPALEAVLAEVEREDVDVIVFGGDLVSGPLPGETLRRIVALGDRARLIRGNADRALVEIRGGAEPEGGLNDRWIASQIGDDGWELLVALPLTLAVDVDGLGPTLFCHATPRDDVEVFHEETPDEEVAPLVEHVSQGVIVCGHTHMQFDRRVAGKRIVNAGSVGMAYGAPGACWAVLGPDVELRRTEYDYEAAAARIRESGWSQADEFAERNVLAVPSREEALAFFEQVRREQRGA